MLRDCNEMPGVLHGLTKDNLCKKVITRFRWPGIGEIYLEATYSLCNPSFSVPTSGVSSKIWCSMMGDLNGRIIIFFVFYTCHMFSGDCRLSHLKCWPGCTLAVYGPSKDQNAKTCLQQFFFFWYHIPPQILIFFLRYSLDFVLICPESIPSRFH